jgi:hypothetical protein
MAIPMSAILLFISLFTVQGLAGSWTATDLCNLGMDPRCPTIVMAVDCVNASFCAVVGGYSDTPMSVYYSANGFQNISVATMVDDSFLLLDLALDAQGHGVTSGIGAVKNSGLMWSRDVLNWDAANDFDFMQGQVRNLFTRSAGCGRRSICTFIRVSVCACCYL